MPDLTRILPEARIPELPNPYYGKVRDCYDLPADAIHPARRILISSDRISAFDRILAAIPFKGQVLTQTARFWFDATADLCPSHVLSYPDPNVVIGRRLTILPVEIVVRGYLAGSTGTSILTLYKQGHRSLYGHILPDGLRDNQPLPAPIITPTSKAFDGGHDEPLTPAQIIAQGLLTPAQWDQVSALALALFARGQQMAAERGLILVDTKYEFGTDETGTILLADEIHTPDSSRYWIASGYDAAFSAGTRPPSFDKDVIRSWVVARCDPYKDPIPTIPPEMIAATSQVYIDAYQAITGQPFVPDLSGPTPLARIRANLTPFFTARLRPHPRRTNVAKNPETPMILSCGEALIDMLPRETTAGEPAFAPYAGGAVFNTAIALGRLGAPSAFFTGLSTDLMGELLDQTLIASKVDTTLCARSARPTTLAFVKLVNGQATYAFYDENTAGRLLSEAELPALPDSIDTLFFGGISLVNDPAASSYEALQARAASTRVTMIDPNIRPGFITDQPTYRARIARMIAVADIVKLSDEDLHWLEGPGDPADLARGLLAKGPKVVFITEGAKGARAVTATQDRFIAATKVTVADTVGAGDTFNAGVLASLHIGGALTKARIADLPDNTLDAALTLGTRAAAITVSRPGANPPWSHEL